MNRWSQQLSLIALVLVLLAACAPNIPQTNRLPTPAATAVVGTPVASTPRTTVPTSQLAIGQQFRVAQRATSDDAVLAKVALEVRTARVDADALRLRIAFVNTSDESFRLIGTMSGRDARLADASGTEYAPLAIDDTLATLDPKTGFAPGTANVGTLTFPVPTGKQPFQLTFPRYQPISFSLDMPQPTPDAAPQQASYLLDTAVRSQRDALRMIELRFKSLEVRADALVFDLGFVNVSRQGYNLTVGPNGSDARLIDGEGQELMPSAVSKPLATSIAPKDGWQPQQEQRGTITFPRPADLSRLRFVFPTYDALTIELNDQGSATTSITSASGGTPAPTAAPSAEELATDAITVLLAKQAAAALAGDAAAFAQTLAPALQPEQATILTQLANMPLASYTLQLAPTATPDAGDTITSVPVELRYTLRGVNDNPFQYAFRYDFARSGDIWQVTKIAPVDNPPFWWNGDLVQRETAHFFVFARPESQADLPALEQEVEQAYATLQAKGLPLEPRYVAYFAASQEDFAALTGRTSRYLGVALSRYEFLGDTISTSSRAFFINGASFRANVGGFGPSERQTTVTHELVHLALAAHTRPFTPPWLVEGMAVYLSGDTGGEPRQRLVNNGQLDTLSLAELTRAGALGEHDLTGERAAYEYTFAGETIAFLVDRFGEPKVLNFYRSYAAIPASSVTANMPRGDAAPIDAAFANLSASLTEAAVPQFFGITIAALDAEVKAWLKR